MIVPKSAIQGPLLILGYGMVNGRKDERRKPPLSGELYLVSTISGVSQDAVKRRAGVRASPRCREVVPTPTTSRPNAVGAVGGRRDPRLRSPPPTEGGIGTGVCHHR